MFEQHKTELGLNLGRFWLGFSGVVLVIVLAALLAGVTGGDNIWSYVVGVAFVASIVWGVLRERARAREIREFAARHGLTYIGGAVPKSFPLHRTESRLAHSIRAAVAGDGRTNEIVFFDCTLGHGKPRFSRTVVGTRGPVGFGPAQHGPDLETEPVDEWFIVFGSRRILTAEEIEALLSEL
jgi:hypothetical protein